MLQVINRRYVSKGTVGRPPQYSSKMGLQEGGDGMAAFIAGSEEPLKHMTMRESLQVLWAWVKRVLQSLSVSAMRNSAAVILGQIADAY